MNYFLFAGATNVGKTEAIERLEKYLLSKGYKSIYKVYRNRPDFNAILEGKNSAGKKIRVILNTAADLQSNIKDLMSFREEYNQHNIIISTIRCDTDPVRDCFFEKLEINPKTDHVTELSMASIHKSRSKYKTIRKWYKEKIDDIAHTLLAGSPFFI